MIDLDRTDRKILDILQRQGRISMTDLAEQIGLSTSPCSERVRRMERDRVITGYHARIDPQAIGKTLLVFVEITLSSKSGDVFDKVRQELLHVPEVVECHRVTGDDCYVMTAYVRDVEHLERVIDEFTAYGQTTTAIMQSAPVPRRGLPLP